MRNLSSLRPKTIKGGKKLKLGVWYGVGGAGAPLGPIVGWGRDPRPFRGSEIVGADRWRLERESRSEEERVGADTVDRNWCRVATTPTRGLVWECEWGPVETLGVVREEWG